MAADVNASSSVPQQRHATRSTSSPIAMLTSPAASSAATTRSVTPTSSQQPYVAGTSSGGIRGRKLSVISNNSKDFANGNGAGGRLPVACAQCHR